jgi:hypothetical protein
MAGRKSEAKHHAAWLCVQRDDLLLGETCFLSNLAQVWAVLTSVTHRNIYLTCRGRGLDECMTKLCMDLGAERSEVCAAAVEARFVEERDSRVRRNNVCDALKFGAFQRGGCVETKYAGFKSDGIAKVDAQAAVALGA